jgi:hypothetical protein
LAARYVDYALRMRCDRVVFVDCIEVSRIAPEHFLVRRVEPAE